MVKSYMKQKALLCSSVTNWQKKPFNFTVHTKWNTACLTGQSQSSYQLRYEILFIGVRWRLPSTKEEEESTKKIAMAKEAQLLLHTCRLLTHAVHKNYPELFFLFLQRDESCRDIEETDSNDLKTRYLQKQLNNLREKVKLFTEHDLNVQAIDSRCRILFPLTFAIVNIIYWIYFIFDSKRS